MASFLSGLKSKKEKLRSVVGGLVGGGERGRSSGGGGEQLSALREESDDGSDSGRGSRAGQVGAHLRSGSGIGREAWPGSCVGDAKVES